MGAKTATETAVGATTANATSTREGEREKSATSTTAPNDYSNTSNHPGITCRVTTSIAAAVAATG